MRIALLILAAIFVTVLVAGALLLTSGRVHERIRVSLVSEAQRELKREITVGTVSGDPFRGIVLENVAVAKVSRLSDGTLFTARRVVVSFELSRLVADLLAGRGPIASIRFIEVINPSVILERNPQGRWNVLDLFPPRPPAAPELPQFNPIITVKQGTLHLTDWLGPQRPFTARFEQGNGTLDLRAIPVVHINAEMISVHGTRRSPASVRGRFTAGQGTFDFDLAVENAPVSQWGPYLVRLPRRVRFEGGSFDGVFHALTTRWGNRLVLDYRGTLRLLDASGVLLPQGARLRGANGLLYADNLRIQTEDLRVTVDGSPLRITGEATMVMGGAIDLAISSPSIDLATLKRLLFPGTGVRLTGRAGGDVRVQGPLSALNAEGTIAGASGSLNGQRFSGGSGGLSLFGGLLAFEDFRLTADGGRLGGDLRLSLQSPNTVVAASATNVPTEALDRAGIIEPPLRGRASGDFVLGRSAAGIAAEGIGTLDAVQARGITFDALSGAFLYDRGSIFLPHVQARRAAGTAHAVGRISRTGALSLDVSAQRLDLRLLAAELGLAGRMVGQMDARGSLAGTLANPVFTGSVTVGAGRVGPLSFDSAIGPVRITRQALSSPGLSVLDDPGTYLVAGTVRWARPAALDLTIDVDNVSAARLALAAGVPVGVTGRVSGRVKVGGSPGQPIVEGSATVGNARVGGQRIDRAAAAFRWMNGVLHIDQAEAHVGTSTLLVKGNVERGGPIRLDFDARAFDLRNLTLFPPQLLNLAGTLALHGELRGTSTQPVLTADVSSSDLTVNGQRFDRAEGRIRWHEGRLILAPVTLRQGPGVYAISGSIGFGEAVSFDLRGDVENGRLATLLRMGGINTAYPLDARVDGVITLGGTRGDPRVTLSAGLTNGVIDTHRVTRADLDLTLSEQVISVRQFRADVAGGILAAQGQLALNGESQFELGGERLPLDILRPLLRLDRQLVGTLNFTTQMSGAVRNPEIGLSVEVREGGTDGLRFDSLTANAFYSDGLLHVEQALLTEGGNRVKGEGTIPFDPVSLRFAGERPMRFTISLVDANLGLLALLTPHVQESSGRLEGEVVLEGSPRTPLMTGRLAVRDGRIKLRALTTVLEQVQADVSFAQDRLTINGLSTKMGDGTVQVEGAISVADFRPVQVERLTLRASDARLELKPFYAGELDANITLTGSFRDPSRPLELAGDVVFKEGELVVGGLTNPTGLRGGPGSPNVRFRDIRLVSGPDLAVHLGRLRIELVEGSLIVLGGTLRAPELSGEVVAEQGVLNAFGRTFRLEEGRAQFAPQLGIVPLITARAETQVGTTRIFIEVIQARADQLSDRMVLRSDPPMTQREILVALAGESGLTELLRGDLQAAVRVELGRALFGAVGQTIAQALGLSEFTINYDFEEPVELRIGKLLVRDLFITLTTVFEQPATRFVWALEWRFTPQWRMSFNVSNTGRLDALVLYTVRF